MCNVYNTIGSLTTIKQKLSQNNINDFKSLNELIAFRDNYSISRKQIISEHEILIAEERNSLSAEIPVLQYEIAKAKTEHEQQARSELERLRQKRDAVLAMDKNYLQEIIYSYVAFFFMLKIKCKEFFFDSKLPSAIRYMVDTLDRKNDRFSYLISNFKEAVEESSRPALRYMDCKKRIIDEINPFIYGAIGEQKVVDELKSLSDDYTLINDFSISFDNPIYYPQEKQYIKTIQIDHLLISPAGIFVIETKNWSKDSLNNLSLRSPVDQIRRSNYALFKILSGNLKLSKHHWGEKKIPIRNLIVLINEKPREEFLHVKVLTLRELTGYIEYFNTSFSNKETQRIADYLESQNLKSISL